MAHQVPLVYVPRPRFVEEAGLLQNLMTPYGIGVELSHAEFYSGNWSKHILKAHKLKQQQNSDPNIVVNRIPCNGGEVAAIAIENLVSKSKQKLKI